jgi:MFS family permease
MPLICYSLPFSSVRRWYFLMCTYFLYGYFVFIFCLSLGLLSWSFILVFCLSHLPWYFVLVFCIGLLSWSSFAMVFCLARSLFWVFCLDLLFLFLVWVFWVFYLGLLSGSFVWGLCVGLLSWFWSLICTWLQTKAFMSCSILPAISDIAKKKPITTPAQRYLRLPEAPIFKPKIKKKVLGLFYPYFRDSAKKPKNFFSNIGSSHHTGTYYTYWGMHTGLPATKERTIGAQSRR